MNKYSILSLLLVVFSVILLFVRTESVPHWEPPSVGLQSQATSYQSIIDPGDYAAYATYDCPWTVFTEEEHKTEEQLLTDIVLDGANEKLPLKYPRPYVPVWSSPVAAPPAVQSVPVIQPQEIEILPIPSIFDQFLTPEPSIREPTIVLTPELPVLVEPTVNVVPMEEKVEEKIPDAEKLESPVLPQEVPTVVVSLAPIQQEEPAIVPVPVPTLVVPVPTTIEEANVEVSVKPVIQELFEQQPQVFELPELPVKPIEIEKSLPVTTEHNSEPSIPHPTVQHVEETSIKTEEEQLPISIPQPTVQPPSEPITIPTIEEPAIVPQNTVEKVPVYQEPVIPPLPSPVIDVPTITPAASPEESHSKVEFVPVYEGPIEETVVEKKEPSLHPETAVTPEVAEPLHQISEQPKQEETAKPDSGHQVAPPPPEVIPEESIKKEVLPEPIPIDQPTVLPVEKSAPIIVDAQPSIHVFEPAIEAIPTLTHAVVVNDEGPKLQSEGPHQETEPEIPVAEPKSEPTIHQQHLNPPITPVPSIATIVEEPLVVPQPTVNHLPDIVENVPVYQEPVTPLVSPVIEPAAVVPQPTIQHLPDPEVPKIPEESHSKAEPVLPEVVDPEKQPEIPIAPVETVPVTAPVPQISDIVSAQPNVHPIDIPVTTAVEHKAKIPEELLKLPPRESSSTPVPKEESVPHQAEPQHTSEKLPEPQPTLPVPVASSEKLEPSPVASVVPVLEQPPVEPSIVLNEACKKACPKKTYYKEVCLKPTTPGLAEHPGKLPEMVEEEENSSKVKHSRKANLKPLFYTTMAVFGAAVIMLTIGGILTALLVYYLKNSRRNFFSVYEERKGQGMQVMNRFDDEELEMEFDDDFSDPFSSHGIEESDDFDDDDYDDDDDDDDDFEDDDEFDDDDDYDSDDL